MTPLAESVRDHLNRWGTASVELGVFDSSDPYQIAGHFEQFCDEHLGAPAQSALFYGSSAGCVAGLHLADGRDVVIKAYQANWGSAFLDSVLVVQRHLRDVGFACPRPLVGPAPVGPAWATAEEYVPDPGMRIFSTEAEMLASAASLATLVDRCQGLSAPWLGQHPLRPPSPAGFGGSVTRLYPDPHNPIFDFSVDAGAAAWIDQLARAARDHRQTDPSEAVIGHTDWSARNIRIDETGLVVAYDWDSLALVPESTVVGQAAATWRSTGEATDPVAPGPDEVLQYLSLYERSADKPFGAHQVRAALAAALWVLAYSARCEHALEAITGKRVDRARARLADDGPSFLAPRPS